MKTAEQLDAEIRALIAQGIDRRSDEQFHRLALDLFEYQFERNLPYRNFCRVRDAEPAKISDWHDVPAVPTTAFKETELTCFPADRAAAVFETSGTTCAKQKRGRHYLETTALYRASIVPNFAAHLLPDSAELPLLILTPSLKEAPHSSLSFMMGVVAEEFGRRGAHYFVRDDQLQVQPLCDALRMAQDFGEPVGLLGTAFAFGHFFDYCARRGLRFKLPKDSRAMETGGFKGKSREMMKQEFYELFDEYLSLPATHILNEYGMTELGVQFYDTKLRLPGPASKFIPPWSRVLIVDPSSGNEVAEGECGLIRVFDLTNRSSVMAIQTEDIGMRVGDGFEVLGRATGAEARGCSIAADEFRIANQRTPE